MKFSRLVKCVFPHSGQIYYFLHMPSHLLGLAGLEPLLFIELSHSGHNGRSYS